MTSLLEIREKVKQIYSKYEVFILPVLKFLLAFVALSSLNGKIGYMSQLDNVALVLMVALLCSFLSTGVLIFFGAIISLAHMYAVSLEVALVGLCVYLIIYLLFFRFSPKDGVVLVLTALLFNMKLSYVVPVAIGLVCTPASVVSMGCGAFVYYFLEIVAVNASNISTMGDEEMLEKVRLMLDTVLANRGMFVVIAVFAIAALVVYCVRRLSVDYAWTIAMVAGALLQVMMLLIGDLLFDINISVGGALLGTVLAVAVGKIIEFFRFCVDYNRTEKVQFEDDEYYYYVKAVPKMAVAKTTKTVKRINAGRGVPVERSTAPVRNPGRSVVTERTGAGRYESAQRPVNRGTDYRTGKSVTVGTTANTATESTEENDSFDYEELF